MRASEPGGRVLIRPACPADPFPGPSVLLPPLVRLALLLRWQRARNEHFAGTRGDLLIGIDSLHKWTFAKARCFGGSWPILLSPRTLHVSALRICWMQLRGNPSRLYRSASDAFPRQLRRGRTCCSQGCDGYGTLRRRATARKMSRKSSSEMRRPSRLSAPRRGWVAMPTSNISDP